ncbi:MAG: hypothetical protein WA432_01715 [Candidatus Babeliaceae bacterium]
MKNTIKSALFLTFLASMTGGVIFGKGKHQKSCTERPGSTESQELENKNNGEKVPRPTLQERLEGMEQAIHDLKSNVQELQKQIELLNKKDKKE